MDLDLGKELGAEAGTSTQRLTLSLPNKDQNGLLVADLAGWLKEARGLLS